MAERYRYITTGVVSPIDKLSAFRLVGGNQLYGEFDAIRVTIPEDVELIKYDSDNYSTTECDMLLKDLDPKFLVRINGRLREDAELTDKWLREEVAPHQTGAYMKQHGYYSYIRFGHITRDMLPFVDKHYDKLWQLKRIPKGDDFAGFYTDKEYQEKFPDIIAYMRELVNSDDEYMLKYIDKDDYKKLQSFSDTKLVDIYAHACFVGCCDTNLSHNFDGSMKYWIRNEFSDEIEDLKYEEPVKSEK